MCCFSESSDLCKWLLRVKVSSLPQQLPGTLVVGQFSLPLTNLRELVGDLGLVAAPAFGLLQADHHQVLKEVLPADVAQLPGVVVLRRHGKWLHTVIVFA